MIHDETITPGGCARGTISVPGDKSISIRAILLSAIADGTSTIKGFGRGKDILSALSCIRQLGIETEYSDHSTVVIHGRGLRGLDTLDVPLNCGNSGTTLRLLTGILAGQRRRYIVTGDASLQQRPMERITTPLGKMGARFESLGEKGKVPLSLSASSLHPVTYTMPVASAQVKSAILLAGLYARGKTTVIEPARSRNHTELMLSSRGVRCSISNDKKRVSVYGVNKLSPLDMTIPGDISGAAFFIVLASLLPNSYLTIENVGINETRNAVIEILRDMGADITVANILSAGGEKTADIRIRSAHLKGIAIEGSVIPRVIDEIPVLAVAAACARGDTTIRGAQELRVKETDRINAVCFNLQNMGIDVEEYPDGMTIHGGKSLKGAEFDSFGDHRIAMAFAVGATIADGVSTIRDSRWADISFPGFYQLLNQVRGISTC